MKKNDKLEDTMKPAPQKLMITIAAWGYKSSTLQALGLWKKKKILKNLITDP